MCRTFLVNYICELQATTLTSTDCWSFSIEAGRALTGHWRRMCLKQGLPKHAAPIINSSLSVVRKRIIEFPVSIDERLTPVVSSKEGRMSENGSRLQRIFTAKRAKKTAFGTE